jgi:hypothetical protein
LSVEIYLIKGIEEYVFSMLIVLLGEKRMKDRYHAEIDM